jgi:hypothetical protein
MLRRLCALVLIVFAWACTTTTSVTRTGTGIFAPRAGDDREEETPIGLSLTVGSIAPDGTVTLDLRNYSNEPFVFAGTPDRPRLLVEVQTGSAHSRYTVSPSLGGKTHEVPAGERIQLKTHISGAEGLVRIGIASKEFGYVVWTDWMGR